jgi:hypothetical protein
MNKTPDETLKQGRNRSWLLVKKQKRPTYRQSLIEIHYINSAGLVVPGGRNSDPI